MHDFFNKNHTVDNVESYVATYSSKYGTYTFNNISAMVEEIYSDPDTSNPDWNKVVLIPVTATVDSKRTAISYGLDIKMRQVKLVGGNTPIKIKTIRTKF